MLEGPSAEREHALSFHSSAWVMSPNRMGDRAMPSCIYGCGYSRTYSALAAVQRTYIGEPMPEVGLQRASTGWVSREERGKGILGHQGVDV